jgi:hypothetical protein
LASGLGATPAPAVAAYFPSHVAPAFAPAVTPAVAPAPPLPAASAYAPAPASASPADPFAAVAVPCLGPKLIPLPMTTSAFGGKWMGMAASEKKATLPADGAATLESSQKRRCLVFWRQTPWLLIWGS